MRTNDSFNFAFTSTFAHKHPSVNLLSSEINKSTLTNTKSLCFTGDTPPASSPFSVNASVGTNSDILAYEEFLATARSLLINKMAPPPKMNEKSARRRITDALRVEKAPAIRDLEFIKDIDSDLHNEGMKSHNTTPAKSGSAKSTSDVNKRKVEQSKRKTGDGNSSEVERQPGAKKAKPVLISEPSKALLARFKPIEDGSTEDTTDVGQKIGEHQIPIGVMKNDPEPQRLAFATYNVEGDLEITPYAFDKKFRAFQESSEHNQRHETNVPFTVTYATMLDFINKYLTLDVSLKSSTSSMIRQYVFDMIRQGAGSDRISGWIDEEEARSSTGCLNQLILDRSKIFEISPVKDPFSLSKNNVTLTQLINQATALYESELRNQNTVVEAWEALTEAGEETTDLKNRDQARRLGHAALEFIERTHQQKVTREIAWAGIRATPRNQSELIEWIPETVLRQLHDTMEHGKDNRNLGLRLRDLETEDAGTPAPVDVPTTGDDG